MNDIRLCPLISFSGRFFDFLLDLRGIQVFFGVVLIDPDVPCYVCGVNRRFQIFLTGGIKVTVLTSVPGNILENRSDPARMAFQEDLFASVK